MRSSKSRSRNKARNQRSLGNVVNRVFDSSGPEGKVRGTPQQIIEKYLALARDAQLSNDRVAEQSFLQHAEHYTRMLGEAQREQAERQAQFGQQQQGGQNGTDDRDDRAGGSQNGGQDQRGDRWEDRQDRREERGDRSDRRDRGPRESQPALTDTTDAVPATAAENPFATQDAGPAGIPEAVTLDDTAAGPVETPEARADDAAEAAQPVPVAAADPDADADTPRPRRRSAAPRRSTPRKRTTGQPDPAPEAPAAED